MMNFKDILSILNSDQFVFILDHHTTNPLFTFIHNVIEAINYNKMLLIIFLNFFSVTLDTVAYEIVLIKLEVSNRTQAVCLCEKRSFLCELNIAVSQGFTFVLSLFINCMNVFYKFRSNPNAFHFADATALYKEIDPSFDTLNLINQELTQAKLWIDADRVSLNFEEK